MRGRFNKLIFTGMFLLLAVTYVAAQTSFTLAQGSINQYHIDAQPNIVSYQWAVFTNENLTSQATAQQVTLNEPGPGRENEIEVEWHQTGTYYLAVFVVDTEDCTNRMAFRFRIIDDLLAHNDRLSLYVDETESLNILQNDEYTVPLDVEIIREPLWGEYTLNPESGELTYTAPTDYVGGDTLQYVISNQLGSDTAFVFITIRPRVQLIAQALCNDEQPMFSWELNVQGTTFDSFELSVFDRQNNRVYTSEVETTGSMVWPDIIENDGFPQWLIPSNLSEIRLEAHYRFSGNTGQATARVNAPDCHINRVVAVWDSATVYGRTIVLDVLANDYDPDGDELDPSSLTIVENSGPYHGQIEVNSDGTLSYHPDAGYTGPDSLIYRICDTNANTACDTAIVRLNLVWTDWIVANANNYYIYIDQPVNLDVTWNDVTYTTNIDYENIEVVSLPQNGTATPNADGTILYVPNEYYEGLDSFQYKICTVEEPVACDAAWVYVEVRENECVIAERIDTLTQVNQSVNINVLEFAFDPEGELDSTSVAIAQQPNNGEAVLNPDFSITYIPHELFAGVDSFIYSICDAAYPVCCAQAVVYIEVIDTNQPIVANPDYATTPFGETVNIDVLANDYDPDGEIDMESLNIHTHPHFGTVVINADGSLSYTPDMGFSGLDSLIYLVCDDGPIVSCDTAMVYITVEGEIVNPVAVDDYVTIGVDEVFNIDVLANDSSSFDATTLDILTPPHNGYVIVESNYTITYYPDYDYAGLDSFMYVVCDLNEWCDSATVFISIEDLVLPPDLFTPNGDGQNDTYVIRGLDRYPNNHFVVYNRWGNVVYELEGYYDQWDGVSNRRGAIGNSQLPVGVYYYILKYGKEREKEKAGALFLER